MKHVKIEALFVYFDRTRVKHNSEGCEKLEKVVMDSIVKIVKITMLCGLNTKKIENEFDITFYIIYRILWWDGKKQVFNIPNIKIT